MWAADARFTELVKTRRPELLRVAMLITGSRADAEDSVQDAVLSVSGAWSGVAPRAGYAYLRTAVVRRAIDGRRRSQTAELVETSVEDHGFLQLEEDRRFVALLQILPPQQRAVLVLRFYNGLDTAAIGLILDIGRSAVRSNLARGLATLRSTESQDGPTQ